MLEAAKTGPVTLEVASCARPAPLLNHRPLLRKNPPARVGGMLLLKPNDAVVVVTLFLFYGASSPLHNGDAQTSRARRCSAARSGSDGRSAKRVSSENHHMTQRPPNCAGSSLARGHS